MEIKERDMMEVVARRKERSKRMFNIKSVEDNTGTDEIGTTVNLSLFNRSEPSFLSGGGWRRDWCRGDWCQQVRLMT